MTVCDKCGNEVGDLLCGHCREKLKDQKTIDPRDLIPLIYFNRKTGKYHAGCYCFECSWNQFGVCITEEASIKDFMLHEYDNDNCIRRFCG
jgi:hypothetical protein